MKAFLSHSSKDKDTVRLVYDALGPGQCEYDECTFDYTFNVQAIRAALARTDMFVYFLSSNSVTSTFVSEEQRSALEGRGKGFIRKVLVFALDDTSYTALPTWLREINIVQKLSSPRACARKIQSALFGLAAESDSINDVYLGRETEDIALRKILSAPPSQTPVALHAVGHYGVGRKTFLKHNLTALFPRRFDTFIELTLPANSGVEELYRQLSELVTVQSVAGRIDDFIRFSTLSTDEQIRILTGIIASISADDEFLLITDDGGVYMDNGDYQPHLKAIVESVATRGLPTLGFVQTRMMPTFIKSENPRSFHQYLSVLSDDVTAEILALTLKQLGIDYTRDQLLLLSQQIDGHPFNIKFVAAYVHDYGLESLIADPSDLIAWKRRRAEDFLQTMVFDGVESDILAALEEYRYLATEMIFAVVGDGTANTVTALRRLQEFSCVEKRASYCHIAPPIRDAIRRDDRFKRSDDWKHQLGRKICDAIAEYRDTDNVSVALLESATLAVARGHKAPAYLSTLILPGHMLTIARDYYDDGKRADCIAFCQRAWDARSRLPIEAQLEVLRLWGLSAVRIEDESTYRHVISLYDKFSGPTAERLKLFVEGFYLRVHKRLDEAEKKFLAAWRLAKRNPSVNRELANLLCKQRRYSDAETYARAAYEQAPTNPFIIDVMAETLIGKVQQNLSINYRELEFVMDALERYGDRPGSSFYLVRRAQTELSRHDYRAALSTINRAVEHTPGLLSARFIRADVQISLRNIDGAESDVAEIQKLLDHAGGFSEGDEARLQELQIRILVERQLLRQAKETLERSAWLPNRVSERMKDLIARAAQFDPAKADDDLKKWADKRLGKRDVARMATRRD